MEQFIGCDAHKKFSLFVAMNEDGEYGRAIRVGHDREVFRAFLKDLPPGSQIALETSGSYYWLVEEMERAGHRPQLAHALTAKQFVRCFWQVPPSRWPAHNRYTKRFRASLGGSSNGDEDSARIRTDASLQLSTILGTGERNHSGPNVP